MIGPVPVAADDVLPSSSEGADLTSGGDVEAAPFSVRDPGRSDARQSHAVMVCRSASNRSSRD